MGKRRITMQRISDDRKRHVTFSKRRKGLFKKAHELCTLTGASIAVFCISEAGNPFTFCYTPPATNEGADHGDDHQRLLSVIQQYEDSCHGCSNTTVTYPSYAQSRSLVVEGKLINQEYHDNEGTCHDLFLNFQAENDKRWVSSQPLIDADDVADVGFEFEPKEEIPWLLKNLQNVEEEVPLRTIVGQSGKEVTMESSGHAGSCNLVSSSGENEESWHSCLYPPSPSMEEASPLWPSVQMPPSSPLVEALKSSVSHEALQSSPLIRALLSSSSLETGLSLPSSSSIDWGNCVDPFGLELEGGIIPMPFTSLF